MNRTLKTCLMVIAWAAIATQFVLTLDTSWWAVLLGLVGGSLGGYLTCEWRTVVWAIPIAWRRATEWRPDREWWQAALYLGLITSSFFLTLMVFINLLVFFSSNHGMTHRWIFITSTLSVGGILCPFLAGILINELPHDPENRRKLLPKLRHIAIRFNFFSFWFWTAPRFCYQWWREDLFPDLCEGVSKIPGELRSASVQSFKRLGKAAIVSARFIWRYYKLIHTEDRRLVAFDIACGVLVGVWYGSSIIGGLAGGAFWLANRLLIAGLCLKTLPVRVR